MQFVLDHEIRWRMGAGLKKPSDFWAAHDLSELVDGANQQRGTPLVNVLIDRVDRQRALGIVQLAVRIDAAGFDRDWASAHRSWLPLKFATTGGTRRQLSR